MIFSMIYVLNGLSKRNQNSKNIFHYKTLYNEKICFVKVFNKNLKKLLSMFLYI